MSVVDRSVPARLQYNKPSILKHISNKPSSAFLNIQNMFQTSYPSPNEVNKSPHKNRCRRDQTLIIGVVK
jgi:hypothetical protein